MQVPVLVNICPVSLKKVLAYVQSLTAVPEYRGATKGLAREKIVIC